MIDHITIQVADLEKSKTFYEKVLAPLGYVQNLTNEAHTFYGFGVGEDPIFEIVQAAEDRPAHKRIHVAFQAKTKEQVNQCHAIALEQGAADNGAPGPRPEYTPSYYAAFFIDPDENNIEICLH